MDQRKIGAFLKYLRNEKNITQEELAEKLNVSGRTVSRWETGSNMPDISLLVDIAEFYDVSIPEIIYGERKNGKMKEEVKETALALSDYTEEINRKMHKALLRLSIAALIGFVMYMVTDSMGLTGGVYDLIRNVALGLSFGLLMVMALYFSGLLIKIKVWVKKALS
ncbi:MAG: helix-turn-helix transcriptional regulator [Erysipelotrichaceae bacterium]|nr:helix-turn-helix transcriptional regulator [Erysipelotrichaceae bacterium]